MTKIERLKKLVSGLSESFPSRERCESLADCYDGIAGAVNRSEDNPLFNVDRALRREYNEIRRMRDALDDAIHMFEQFCPEVKSDVFSLSEDW